MATLSISFQSSLPLEPFLIFQMFLVLGTFNVCMLSCFLVTISFAEARPDLEPNGSCLSLITCHLLVSLVMRLLLSKQSNRCLQFRRLTCVNYAIELHLK